MADAHFTTELFDYLFDLDVNNEKAWFDANRDRFEQHVREPMLRFIADFEAPLRSISRHFVADPRKQGGSMFRIHRNRRFNPTAPPYKTWAAAQFRHEAGRDVHAPGFYLHLEPGNVFLGAGMWHPDREALAAVRTRILEHPREWRAARSGTLSRGAWELAGGALKTAPRGIDAEHPLIEDLRRTDFIATAPLDEREACRHDFLARFTGACEQGVPLVRFLCRAVGVPF